MRSPRTTRTAVAAGVLAVGMAVTTAAPAHAATVDPVAGGFVGPLGLSIGADGTIYVMDGLAGTLSVVRDGETEVVATGPLSGGVDAAGRGQVVYTTRDGAPGVTPDSASLFRVTPSGESREVASLLDHDASANPDAVNMYGFVDLDAECAAEVEAVFGPGFGGMYPGQVDSNPYAVAFHKGGYLVADAGGNTIVRVDANGRTSTVAVLPPIETTMGPEVLEFGAPECVVGATYLSEPVPTDIEVGPDGNYYVSSLPGFPETPGSGSVFMVTPSGSVSLVATGFSGAVDLAVADDGTIYVAELFANRISQVVDGVVSTLVEVPAPGAVEVARDGTIYATIGVFGDGQVVTVTP